jgi:hypothetical protein
MALLRWHSTFNRVSAQLTYTFPNCVLKPGVLEILTAESSSSMQNKAGMTHVSAGTGKHAQTQMIYIITEFTFVAMSLDGNQALAGQPVPVSRRHALGMAVFTTLCSLS